jgi:multiple antibiotic resistance protein
MATLVQHFAHVFFLVYAGLFPIVNPVGTAPIFLALTRYCTDRE